jgi:2-amino-4-hydroxy-6-hydroxymethyldihydropteridine diphosphokinase
MNKAVIALGSNIEPNKHIANALKALANTFSLLKRSEFIYTKPVGYTNQPDFLNGSVLVEVASGKEDIIFTLKRIEYDLGRQRNGKKDGPRRIDLDLLLFNEQIIDEDIFERDFLLRSIRELLPGVELHRDK